MKSETPKLDRFIYSVVIVSSRPAIRPSTTLNPAIKLLTYKRVTAAGLIEKGQGSFGRWVNFAPHSTVISDPLEHVQLDNMPFLISQRWQEDKILLTDR